MKVVASCAIGLLAACALASVAAAPADGAPADITSSGLASSGFASSAVASAGIASVGVAAGAGSSGVSEAHAALTITTPTRGGSEALGAAPAQPASPSGLTVPVAMPVADQVIVRKSERRLYLMRDGKVLRSYRISLGLEPQGPKERAGDFRTPEGHYFLTRRNPRSDYFLSILVSYPSAGDRARAQREHVDPGGEIMLHGLPNILRHKPNFYEHSDWTDGCIALSDSDMVEVWLMTRENTPIEILP